MAGDRVLCNDFRLFPLTAVVPLIPGTLGARPSRSKLFFHRARLLYLSVSLLTIGHFPRKHDTVLLYGVNLYSRPILWERSQQFKKTTAQTCQGVYLRMKLEL